MFKWICKYSIIGILAILLAMVCSCVPTTTKVGMSYGATGRTATITIAASNATETEKAQADYVCTGTSTLSGTLTNRTGIATGSPITLVSGQVINITQAGNFTVVLAAGQTGVASIGTITTINGVKTATQLSAGSNVITVAGTGTMFISGMGDEGVINNAINSLLPNGGKIFLSSGNFNICNSINLFGAIWLQGSGLGYNSSQVNTLLTAASNFPVVYINGSGTNQYFTQVTDMHIIGVSENRIGGIGVQVTASASDGRYSNLFINNMWTDIELDSGWYFRIDDCWLESAHFGIIEYANNTEISNTNITSGYAISVDNETNQLMVSNSFITASGGGAIPIYGIFLDAGGPLYQVITFNNVDMRDSAASSFTVYNNNDVNVTFTGCTLGNTITTKSTYLVSPWETGNGRLDVTYNSCTIFPVTTAFINDAHGSSTHNELIRLTNNNKLNPIGLILNPVDSSGFIGLARNGKASATVVASTIYCIMGVDCMVTSTGGTGVSITILDSPVNTTLSSNASSGQKNIVVSSVTGINIGQTYTIGDGTDGTEQNTVASITLSTKTLTMVNNLISTYHTANIAKLTGNTIVSGLSTLTMQTLPIGYAINFGGFSISPTITVYGN